MTGRRLLRIKALESSPLGMEGFWGRKSPTSRGKKKPQEEPWITLFNTSFKCEKYGRDCYSRIGLYSLHKLMPRSVQFYCLIRQAYAYSHYSFLHIFKATNGAAKLSISGFLPLYFKVFFLLCCWSSATLHFCFVHLSLKLLLSTLTPALLLMVYCFLFWANISLCGGFFSLRKVEEEEAIFSSSFFLYSMIYLEKSVLWFHPL